MFSNNNQDWGLSDFSCEEIADQKFGGWGVKFTGMGVGNDLLYAVHLFLSCLKYIKNKFLQKIASSLCKFP